MVGNPKYQTGLRRSDLDLRSMKEGKNLKEKWALSEVMSVKLHDYDWRELGASKWTWNRKSFYMIKLKDNKSLVLDGSKTIIGYVVTSEIDEWFNAGDGIDFGGSDDS